MALEVFKLVGRLTLDGHGKVASQLSGVSKSVDSANKKLIGAGRAMQSFGKSTHAVGKTLTNAITLPMAALGGTAIAKGLSRLIGIDEAKAKLSGLGHSTKEIEAIMGSALDAVRGTSFGLDEAATIAASAVAAGIKPGKELTKYLTTTGDAAAIAGTSLGEMGSILNKVQTTNKAYTGDLNQLANRGIPIYQWLAKQAGVTEEAVADMASSGEITSKMFLQAIEENIGGAAQIMGEKSFVSSLKNMWAAVGRLGASFLDAGGDGQGFFGQLKPILGNLTAGIDTMAGTAEAMGAKFGAAFAKVVEKVMQVARWFSNLSGNQKKLVGMFVAIAAAAGPFLMILGKVIMVIGGLVTAIGTIGLGAVAAIAGIALLVAGIAALIAFVPGVREAFVAAFGYVRDFVMAAITTMRNWWDSNGQAILAKAKEIFGQIRSVVTTVIGRVVEIAKGFIDQVLQWWSTHGQNLINTAVNIFTMVYAFVSDLVGQVVAFIQEKLALIQQFWDENGQAIVQAVQNAFGILLSIITPVVNGIVALIQFAMPLVLSIIQGIWENIKGVISGALDFIMGLVKVFAGLFTGDFSKMWEGVKQMFSGAVQFVWNLVQLWFLGRVMGIFRSFGSSALGVIRGAWNSIMTTARNFVSTIASVISRMVANVVRFFSNLRSQGTSIFNGIRSTISNIVSGLVSSVVRFFTNMVTNATSRFNTIRSTASSVFNRVKTAIMTPIRAAADFVKRQIDRIKSFFDNLKISFPKIKLPKFKLDGEFSLMPPSVPKIGVDWYKNGGVFNAASIIGVGEEPGVSEAVVPLRDDVFSQIGAGIIRASGGTGQLSNATAQQPVKPIVNVYLDGDNVTSLLEQKFSVRQGDTVVGNNRRRGDK